MYLQNKFLKIMMKIKNKQFNKIRQKRETKIKKIHRMLEWI